MFFLLLSLIDFESALYALVTVLLATIVGLILTLCVLYAFLGPASLASRVLRDYLNNNRVPDLLTNFRAEAGRVLAHA
jgi:hypothetical protein